MQIIEASQLVYKYPSDSHNAVNDVSFTVEEGEFLCIVGPNGSGKSTVARMLNGLITPDQGTLRIAGETADTEENIWNIRKKCGMVFQNPDNQLVATIVEEDVAFGLENLGVPSKEIRARVNEALSAVGMEKYAMTQPHMLSGGQKQRIAIAGVLAMRPQIIVFDESTAMLDPAGRKSILNLAKKLHRDEKITILWITHFMDEAAQADRILVMKDGSTFAEGTPKEIFARHDVLAEAGLDIPEVAKMAEEMRKRGILVAGDVLQIEEMAVELCRFK